MGGPGVTAPRGARVARGVAAAVLLVGGLSLSGILVVRALRPTAPAPPATGRGLAERPAQVTLRITGAPAGAEVRTRAGARLGEAPAVALPYGTRPLALVVDAAGFAPATLVVVPDRDQARDVALTPR